MLLTEAKSRVYYRRIDTLLVATPLRNNFAASINFNYL